MKEVPGLVIFCILTLSIAFCLALFMTPSNNDLREVKQEVTQELLNLIERQTDVIRDQAKDIRELRLKVLELEYHRHD